jgi:hypothetical protein
MELPGRNAPSWVSSFLFLTLCLIAVGNLLATPQVVRRDAKVDKPPANQTDQPAVIQDLKVFLPAYSAGKHGSTCNEKLAQALCEWRIRETDLWRQGYGELLTGKTLLTLRDYQGAKQHCLVAVQAASKKLPLGDPLPQRLQPLPASDYSRDAEDCVKQAEDSQDGIDVHAIESLVNLEMLNLKTGDIDKAKAVHDELRKAYSGLAPSSVRARSFAESHLSSGTEGDWSAVLAWSRSKLKLLVAQVFIISLAVVWLYLLLRIFRSLRNGARGFSRRTTKWFVQYIKDDQNQGAAGAVMDALSVSGNALLRKPFVPPSLLLVPPGFGGPGGGGVWWNFVGAVRPPFEIEKLPRSEIEKHQFVLQNDLEEVNLKIAGSELSGVVSLGRNVARWFNKGTPMVQGAVVKLEGEGQNPSWAVRLTATSAFKWARWLLDDPESEKTQSLTMSVYASTEEQEFVDAIGLAAQRAAFKLFYRLAKPGKDTDEITAVAAFHQAVVLLRRYL